MSVNLTEGAIRRVCERELVAEDELKPILQVVDMKIVKTPQNQNQNQTLDKERLRYRMVLSDGVNMQQGMLATQHNHFVDSGRLQKGSIIKMNNFVCSPIKERLIIVVVDLDIVLDKHDIIGEPVMAKIPGSEAARLNVPTPSVPNMHAGSYATNFESGRHPQINAMPMHSNAQMGTPRPVQFSGSYGSRNMDFQNNGGEVMNQPVKPEVGPQSVPFGGSYGNQNMGFRHNMNEVSRPVVNNYNRPQSVYQQPLPMYMNRGPIMKNEAPPRIIPIAALNPYQSRWTIKARVTAKGELRHYNNPRGDGKVFSFDLLDSDGGEIRVTCFNAVADQFFNQIEPGKVYLISKGSLKPAQKNFNHLRNDHEIFLETTSIIQPCFEDDEVIPRQQFHFNPISHIEGMESNSIVDLIGVAYSISPTTSIMRKNGTETQKRIVQLKDESGRSVELTLWGNFCNAEGQGVQNLCDSGQCPVLAVKSGRVSDFNGKAIGTISTSQLFIEPDIQEARKLKDWYDREGKNVPSLSLSREVSTISRTDSRKTISQIKDEKLGTSEKPDWITVSATISYIKIDNFCYTACPIMIGDRQCNKKVTNNGDGKWRCDRCDRCIDECDYRYILQIQIQDHTGLTWVTAFQESGEEIMGISARELFHLKVEQEDERFGEIIRKVLFTKFTFKLKVKEEIFSDEQRVKSTVIKADRMNYSSEASLLLDLLDKAKAEPSSCANAETSFQNPATSGILESNVDKGQASFMGNNNTQGGYVGYQSSANPVFQYGNQYGASKVPTSSMNLPLNCTSCGRNGHSSMNCPSIMSGPAQHTLGGSYTNQATAGSGGNTCFKCNQPGHWARDCPGLNAVPPAYGSSIAGPGRYGMVTR